MCSILNAFRSPFDLKSTVSEWTDAPTFNGRPKRDLPVTDWLQRIEAGCVVRKIPKVYWVEVAQQFMGSDAKARLVELKEVIVKVNGGQYRWTWQKFKIAMENMGWNIAYGKKETIWFSNTGLWSRMRKKDGMKSELAASKKATRPLLLQRSSSSFWKKGSKEETAPSLLPVTPAKNRIKECDVFVAAIKYRKSPARSKTEIFPAPKLEHPEGNGLATEPRLSRRNTEAGSTGVTSVTQAPAWLLNACSALESITSDYPQAMSIISAILITVGSIPCIPAITAGAGGAMLASHTAQAVGAVAVGIGQVLSSQSMAQQSKLKKGGPKQAEGETSLP